MQVVDESWWQLCGFKFAEMNTRTSKTHSYGSVWLGGVFAVNTQTRSAWSPAESKHKINTAWREPNDSLTGMLSTSLASLSWSDLKEGGLPPTIRHRQGWGNRDYTRGCILQEIIEYYCINLPFSSASMGFGTHPGTVSVNMHVPVSNALMP